MFNIQIGVAKFDQWDFDVGGAYELNTTDYKPHDQWNVLLH